MKPNKRNHEAQSFIRSFIELYVLNSDNHSCVLLKVLDFFGMKILTVKKIENQV